MAADATRPASPRPRVLVVDDNESNRVLAQRVLRDAGFDVSTASGGVQALQLITSSGLFDVYVLDVRMPGMTGPELADRLRTFEPQAKILYFAAYGGQLFEPTPKLRANERFIQKPISVTALREAVSLLLSGGVESGDDPARNSADSPAQPGSDD